MNKLYMDPNLPNKKWTVYVPNNEIYKPLKNMSIESEENINEMVAEAFRIYMELFPMIKDLRHEAEFSDFSLEQYVKNIISNRPTGKTD